MEKTGAILLEDDKYVPPQLMIPLSREDFDQLQKRESYRKEETFMQLILRSYSGVFSRYVTIDEEELARRAGCTRRQVVAKLHQLHDLGYIDYQPGTSLPQLLFVRPRVEEQRLFYDRTVYTRRKEVAAKRLESVQHYVTTDSICRSRQLLAYFGEMESPACGKCDVCLKRAKEQFTKDEFLQISEAVLSIYDECEDIKAVVECLCTRFDEEKIVNVTRWLIDNRKIIQK